MDAEDVVWGLLLLLAGTGNGLPDEPSHKRSSLWRLVQSPTPLVFNRHPACELFTSQELLAADGEKRDLNHSMNSQSTPDLDPCEHAYHTSLNSCRYLLVLRNPLDPSLLAKGVKGVHMGNIHWESNVLGTVMVEVSD